MKRAFSEKLWTLSIVISGNICCSGTIKRLFKQYGEQTVWKEVTKGRLLSDTCLIHLYQHVTARYSFVFLLQNLDEIWDRFRVKMHKKQIEFGSKRYDDGNIMLELEQTLSWALFWWNQFANKIHIL